MKVDKKGDTVILRHTKGDVHSFSEKITGEYNSFKESHIIIDLTHDTSVGLSDVLLFLTLSNKHRKAKKSFVIVVNDFDFDEAPEEMVLVPTLLEAHDIIQMEEIERDLGF
ncbi:ribonuclease Z [Flavobacterium rhizosphaerae]|uniref:Ribonuclease Z n=1 Tax=Flavobacterium rhizosphaerae TaxID=3163298 RepID=A0ABW8YW14_9FLAO